MIDKSQLKIFLKLNGLRPESSDKEIKSVLMNAKWHEDDVKNALLVLRDGAEAKGEYVESLYKVFRSDDGRLKPETIASLLGIHIEVKNIDIMRPKTKPIFHSIYKALEIVFISIVLAALAFVGALWYFKAGMFHISAA